MSDGKKEEYLDKIKLALSKKETNFKKIMINHSNELIFLTNYFSIKNLYEKLNEQGNFISKELFYKYMKMLPDYSTNFKPLNDIKETKPKERYEDKKLNQAKNDTSEPLHFTEIEIDEDQLNLFKSALKNSERCARKAIANGLSYEFVKSEFNACTSVIQVTNKLDKIIEDIENGNK